MRKYLILLAVIMLSKFSFAQQEKTILDGSIRINRKSIPEQVIDSFSRIYPDAKSIKYYKTPASVAAKGWSITRQSSIQPRTAIDSVSPADYYMIDFKKSGIHYYGLFAADGSLMKTRMRQHVEDLPGPIRESLNTLDKVFPGYRVVSGTYYKSVGLQGQKEHYEILVQKDFETMVLIYDPSGKLLNAK